MDLYAAMTVDLPECEQDGLKVEKFTVPPNDFFNWKLGARATRPGTYTALKINGALWMSDTDAEKKDHLPALWAMQSWEAKRVLINGLGLGMVLKAALAMDHVEHVDVVEIDERVINIIGPHYTKDSRVQIHHADAYEQMSRWPTGTRWDVGWSDIWLHASTDNLADMARLRRSYGRRTDWHDCWLRETLVSIQRKEREEDKQREMFRAAFRRSLATR